MIKMTLDILLHKRIRHKGDYRKEYILFLHNARHAAAS
jgi:hypothetical protein